MSEVIPKTVPWAKQIADLEPAKKLPFPVKDSNYVHSIVSQIRKKYPLRAYKVETVAEAIEVLRLEDTVI